MKILFSLLAVLVTATVVLNGFAGTATKADSFMIKTAQSQTLEMMSSQTALEKSSNQEVRRFAQMTIEKQTVTNEELKTIAANKSVSLSNVVSSKQQAMIDLLNRTSANTEFDREYIKMQIKVHEDAVKLFQKQANDTDAEDADTRTFAARQLPALQARLTMARMIYSQIRENSAVSAK